MRRGGMLSKVGAMMLTINALLSSGRWFFNMAPVYTKDTLQSHLIAFP